MKLLNVGCGGQRPQDECWWNLDNLRTQLKEGTPERINLDKEPRYIECDLLLQSLPCPDGYFDGILLQHVLEHFTCHQAVDVLVACRHVLADGGVILVSVPDADYFQKVYYQDCKENAEQLFGEPIHDAEFDKFFDYALFRHDHKQVLTMPALECLLLRAGFKKANLHWKRQPMYGLMESQLSRRKFSVELAAVR